jgi:hypothetical protein
MKRFSILLSLLLLVLLAVFTSCRASSAQSFRSAVTDESETASVSGESDSQGTTSDVAGNEVIGPHPEDGARCLFIGHSFFVPVAKSFDRIAAQSGFSSHHAGFVFSSGARGTPGMLWENQTQRQKIEEMLASGDVDIFGMTVSSNTENAYAVYAQWIDLALSYNPNTTFFIGQPWLPRGPQADSQQYDTLTETGAQRTMEVVAQLRDGYPNHRIHFINYGKVVSKMKLEFDAGHLPDIEELVGRGPTYLFSDGAIGHGGPLVHELSALTWINTLYGADVHTLAHSDFSEEATNILLEVIQYNSAFK